MTWYETLIWILGGSGCIGGFYSLYTAKVQKKRIQVEVTQMLNDEWKKLFDNLKNDTTCRIKSLESKIFKLELKDEIKNRAINQVIKCPYPSKVNTCPIADYLEQADDVLKKNILNAKK